VLDDRLAFERLARVPSEVPATITEVSQAAA
jgi:hypothetical protein